MIGVFLIFSILRERNELSTSCASVRFPLFRLNSSNSCPLMVYGCFSVNTRVEIASCFKVEKSISKTRVHNQYRVRI